VAFEARTPERSFVATIRPRVESDLGFRVPGKVAQRLVNVGDAVTAGQALATLDPTDLRLQQEQAEAEMRAGGAALAQAEAELKRITTLRGEGWSTASGLDRQKAATEEARGRVARAERSLALAQNALSYATLAADADGVVTAVQVEPGQVLAAGQTAIRLARLQEKEAVVAVPEAQVAAVRDGRASLTLWSDPGRRYGAVLRELSPSADPATRTYLARFAVPEADAAVRLGMTATVTVGDAAAARVARLPLSALYNQGGGPSVWVVDVDGRPVLRPVAVESYEARDVLVSRGLAEGDKVITLGVQKLDAGQRVRIVQALEF
jgi:RND family efflux transporter MFP subunit